jgi:hypothetical protein
MTMRTFQYVTHPISEKIHLIEPPRIVTLCGAVTDALWGMGDETTAGIQTDCASCRRRMRGPAPTDDEGVEGELVAAAWPQETVTAYMATYDEHEERRRRLVRELWAR